MSDVASAKALEEMAKHDVMNSDVLIAGAMALRGRGEEATLRDEFALAALTGMIASDKAGAFTTQGTARQAYLRTR